MKAKVLDGKVLSATILADLKTKILNLPAHFCKPKLVIVQVLGDEASAIYVKRKLKIAKEIGVEALHLTFPHEVIQQEVEQCLTALSQDHSVHGILLQLPLPSHLNKFALLACIEAQKDVDGLTPYNLGCLMQKHPILMPCTPTGIIRLLEHYEISLFGKEMIILNASALVGRPLALQALDKGATVTLCHSKTLQLSEHVKRADILVSATGKPHLVPADWLNPGVVVIDVGVHREPKLGLVGDVQAADKVASWVTPVPGGVGPMTIAMLMENVWTAYQMALTKQP